MRKALVLSGALAASVCAGAGASPGRAGNQLTVTFDRPGNILCEEAIRYSPASPDPDVRLDVYYPKEAGKPGFARVPCLLMIHGGGWSMGTEKKFAMFAAYAASRGYVVACIAYRLLPEYEIEDCIEDCWTALKWLKENAAKYGGDASRVGVTGGSAGGHLACMLATAKKSEICRKVFDGTGVSPDVQAAAPMAPVTDFSADPKRFARLFRNSPDTAGRAGKCSPLPYVDGDSAPMHLFHAKNDPVVPIAESENIRAAYKKAGLDCSVTAYDSSNHAFWNTHPVGAERMRAWTDVVDFFDAVLKAPAGR
jgi:acetyl esterase/lipase